MSECECSLACTVTIPVEFPQMQVVALKTAAALCSVLTAASAACSVQTGAAAWTFPPVAVCAVLMVKALKLCCPISHAWLASVGMLELLLPQQGLLQ